ncbi:DUF3099 domain-containing protein [Rothia sp. P6271]|uniref:DUF3099 domain-containing protein n=1 Tax=unclassified Rothia (in: high G+C Gram-positive bacteria) TaxID=2689056 RepID=UPI003AD3C36C
MSKKYWTAEDIEQLGYVGSSEPEVYSITHAPSPHSESVDYRWRLYSIKMALRVVCIIGAVLTHGWVSVVFFIGAALLPWFAVVVANGHHRGAGGDFSPYHVPSQEPLALCTDMGQDSRNRTSDENDSAEVWVIDGEVIPPSDSLGRDV